jgi:C_GCAxxG_C_C family probable redox protein
MSKALPAVEEFIKGFACSQAVFAAFSQELGLDRETALKVSCGLGAGMGRTGQTCGAVTGAYLVIGLKYGRTQLEDLASRTQTYDLVKEFDRLFKQRHGSVHCTELLDGCFLGDPAMYEKVAANGLFRKLCPEYVRSAVEILEEIAR